MASESGVTSFSVGQISQLLSKSRKRKRHDEENSGLQNLFNLSSTEKPVFVPVIEKKKKKITDNKDAQEKPLKTKKSKKDVKTGEPNKDSDDDDDSDDNKTPFKSKKSLEDPERLKRTVFVGNIPVAVKKKAIKKLFDKFGEVESVRFRSAALAKPTMSRTVGMKRQEFHKDRHTLNGYVVFKDQSSAVDALQSNGDEVEGLHIRVDIAADSKVHDHSRSVFVGNLSFGTESEPLRELFKDCGEIESVRLIRDGKTGIGKGFGFILFKTKDAVGFAIKLNQTKFNGRPIRVFPSSEHPRTGHKGLKGHKGHNFTSKVKKGKPETYSFSGLQAKKNQKTKNLKHLKRKDNLGSKKKSKDRGGKNSGLPSKRSLAYKHALNKTTKTK